MNSRFAGNYLCNAEIISPEGRNSLFSTAQNYFFFMFAFLVFSVDTNMR